MEYLSNQARGSLDRIDLSASPPTAFAITSPEIRITRVVFNVIGAGPGSNQQPRVMIRISGVTQIKSVSAADQVPFDLQTTIVERSTEKL